MTRGVGTRARGIAAVVLAVALMGGLLFSALGAVAHTGDWIDSSWTVAPPTVDGQMTAGEWVDATAIDLASIGGNQLAAWLLVKNDASFLYIAYDAVGDTSANTNDIASVSFDTFHDAFAGSGGEDQFAWGAGVGGSMHLVSDGFSWYVEDSPFDPGLPDHSGLASAYGFGPSDMTATDHRIFELQIPLILINVAPGEVIGFLGASLPSPGILDETGFRYSTWPVYLLGPPPLAEYGDLRLGKPAQANDVDLNPPSQGQTAMPGSSVPYPIDVVNRGTASDVFDITVASGWGATLLDAGGVNPLTDTDADAVPDTGPVAPGGSARIWVRIDVPPASGCDVASVVGTSSNDPLVDDVASLRTCAISASLFPPHDDRAIDTDAPPNGLYDELVIDVNVSVSSADFYIIDVLLLDQTMTFFITSNSVNRFLSTGLQTVPVTLSGMDIFLTGINGPYAALIGLYDRDRNLIDNGVHMTAAYAFTAFDPPAAEFSPPYSDAGLDLDAPPDGLYDVLRIDVGVIVNEAGSFILSGTLYDPSGFYVTSEETAVTLGVGPHTIPFDILGREIFLSGLAGPYTVFLQLYTSDFRFLDFDVYMTGPYSSDAFDRPPAMFSPPHGDRGLDLDAPPDGLYEFLQVDAAVDVREAGTYTVDAFLTDLTGTMYLGAAVGTANIGTGLQSIPLRFDGLVIRASGIPGPYIAMMTLTDALGALDRGQHRTQAYATSDFSPPGALFAPPHSDALIDVDAPPDGLADYLEVRASVDVARAGTYTVQSLLVSAQNSLLGFDTSCGTPLPAGPATCPLRFDGHEIRAAGIDGPYLAYMLLIDQWGRQLDQDTHTTGLYAASAFEPTDNEGPSATAFPVPYYRNRAMDVPFDASDPSPTDGLASVTLHYRYSADNATWSGWQAYLTVAVTGNSAAGTIGFGFPDGAGYYEFQMTAMDRAGYVETTGATESRVLYRPVTGFRFVPDPVTVTAGQPQPVTVWAYGPDGQPAILESSMIVALSTSSLAGEFRASGTSTRVVSVTIPVGAATADVDYYDTATGTWDLRANAGGLEGRTTAVVEAGPVTTVDIDPPSASIDVGGTLQFSATAFDAFGNPSSDATFVWSADATVGTISSTGFLTASTTVASGAVTVVVSGAPTVSDAASVALDPGPAARVVVDPPSAAIAVGGTQTFTATVEDAYGNALTTAAVTWSVTDAIGTITGSGTLTARNTVGAGRVVATSSSLQGFAAVVLNPGAASTIEITPSAVTLRWGTAVDLRVVVKDAFGNVILDPSVSWTASGPGALSNATGTTTRLTMSGPGAVTVTATSGSATATATITAIEEGMNPTGVAGIGIGAVIAGVVVGLLIGWMVGKRKRGAVEPAPPPKMDE